MHYSDICVWVVPHNIFDAEDYNNILQGIEFSKLSDYIEDLKSPKRREEVLIGYLSMNEIYRILKIPIKYYNFLTKCWGLFPDNGTHDYIYMSKSHSGGFSVFATAFTPIGIDIEGKKRILAKISGFFMRLVRILDINSINEREALMFWTLYESVGKFGFFSINDDVNILRTIGTKLINPARAVCTHHCIMAKLDGKTFTALFWENRFLPLFGCILLMGSRKKRLRIYLANKIGRKDTIFSPVTFNLIGEWII